MEKQPAYKNEKLDFEERVKDLISRMTLDEKVSQILHKAPAIPRLGIQEYTWWNEALHGVARAGTATMFPQAIGMASSFDEKLIFKAAGIISTEARVKFHEFQKKGDRDIYKGLTFWSPNINIFRDPRWGRGQETYGEDPFLTGKLAVAFIKGLQGNDKKYLKAAACAKHFAVHSGPEEGRHSFNAGVSEKDLRETYLPAFEACVKEAGVEAVMCAYNRVNGEPCCGSKKLLLDILRKEWDFKGHVVSDCGALKDFNKNHKVTRTFSKSAALAVNNGCDLNCGKVYESLMVAFRQGLVSEETIDKAASRVLKTRFKLGMFDNPEKFAWSKIPYKKNDCEAHAKFALEVSKNSLVLLKNEQSILPLKRKSLKTLAVIGPNADSRDALRGNYFGTASRYVTVLQGIQKAAGKSARILYAEGCHLFKDRNVKQSLPEDRFAEAVSAAERADAVVLCLGLDANIEGEQGNVEDEFGGGDRSNLSLPGLQQKLLERICKTGTPVILVLFSGSPLAISWADKNVRAIIQAWYPGAQGGEAISSLIFGGFSPSGRLPVTFYKTSGELPDFSDYSMKHRTYRYMKREALYPFGYGLSFTKFLYSNFILDRKILKPGESVKGGITVKNTGGRDSYETLQVYVKKTRRKDLGPKWELRNVRKVFLKKGQEQKIKFTIRPQDMAVIRHNGLPVVEPGLFEIYAGGNQPDKRSVKLSGSTVLSRIFEVRGEDLYLRSRI